MTGLYYVVCWLDEVVDGRAGAEAETGAEPDADVETGADTVPPCWVAFTAGTGVGAAADGATADCWVDVAPDAGEAVPPVRFAPAGAEPFRASV